MHCRSCGTEGLELILDLGNHAWCNHFLTKEEIGTEQTYPLRMVRCADCTLVQLDYTVPKETMFKNHTYVSGTTHTLGKHFYNLAKINIARYNLNHSSLIVDIGGNDGTQLLQYKKLGCENVVNVESADNIAALARKAGVITDNEFFNEEYVNQSGMEGKAKLVSASGVFFHLEELDSVCKGIYKLLADDGVFCVQFMYLGDMITKGSFDGIYHEHLCYYSLWSIARLLNKYDLYINRVERSPIHGGSVVIWASKLTKRTDLTQLLEFYEQVDKITTSHKAITKFATGVINTKERLLQDIQTHGPIMGIGAPAKGNTLLTYLGVTENDIMYLTESNPMKVGLYTPVTHIPIKQESIGAVQSAIYFGIDRHYFVLAWNFFEEIKKKYPENTKFIVPFGDKECKT